MRRVAVDCACADMRRGRHRRCVHAAVPHLPCQVQARRPAGSQSSTWQGLLVVADRPSEELGQDVPLPRDAKGVWPRSWPRQMPPPVTFLIFFGECPATSGNWDLEVWVSVPSVRPRGQGRPGLGGPGGERPLRAGCGSRSRWKEVRSDGSSGPACHGSGPSALRNTGEPGFLAASYLLLTTASLACPLANTPVPAPERRLKRIRRRLAGEMAGLPARGP